MGYRAGGDGGSGLSGGGGSGFGRSSGLCDGGYGVDLDAVQSHLLPILKKSTVETVKSKVRQPWPVNVRESDMCIEYWTRPLLVV